MNNGNPWRISTLVSACYEFLLALFLLFQMLLALLVLEVAKFLPVGRVCSCSKPRQHNAFCSGHFPPFSPCRQRDSVKLTEIAGSSRTPTRLSRGLPPGRALSEDLSASSDASEITFPRRAGLANQARSLSLTSAYKRKGRHNSTATVEGGPSECKGSVDGDTCQCIAAGLELYDDLIEVSSEYLKQKDRGHEEVILSLLKALQVERRNLRTLYEELEEERVAAETAANEAMAMILRLQEEKSALQMEADHYQRLAEEKARHDEHAIQLLEEDLCQKENERLLLEEELSELRRRSEGDDDVLDIAERATCCRCMVSKPLFLLTGIEEASKQEEQEVETVIKSQDTAGLECVISTCVASEEEYSEGLPTAGQPLKRFKSFAQDGTLSDSNDLQIAEEIVESPLIEPNMHSEKLQPKYEDDAKALLVQLSAVEKQLLALEESENLELWQQAQASRDSFINELLRSADKSSGATQFAEDENVGRLQMHRNNARASEAEASCMLDEERVVNVDVANVTDGPFGEIHIPGSEEIFEIQEGKRQSSKVVQCEASEEEKHLDMPSFVRSNLNQSVTSTLEGTCKPGLEEDWDAKRVTLEGINLRLQALENESTLLRHCSVPSDHEYVNLALLKGIMQELQELLKANRNVSAAKEAMSAFAKGDMQHKKRHYADGPGQFL